MIQHGFTVQYEGEANELGQRHGAGMVGGSVVFISAMCKLKCAHPGRTILEGGHLFEGNWQHNRREGVGES